MRKFRSPLLHWRIIITYPAFDREEGEDISNLEGMEPAHYVYSLCLTLTLIGKKLDARKYSQWVSRRMRSFSAPLGLTKNDPQLNEITPSYDFVTTFYDNIKIYWQVRRLFYLNIYTFAGKTDLLGVGAGITLNPKGS